MSLHIHTIEAFCCDILVISRVIVRRCFVVFDVFEFDEIALTICLDWLNLSQAHDKCMAIELLKTIEKNLTPSKPSSERV